LPYPGGPLVDQHARLGNPKAFQFAEPNMPELNFSFSGLKTSILYFLQKQKALDPDFIANNLNDLCASIQDTIIRILMKKLLKATKETGIKQVCIAGGVSANSGLREALMSYATRYHWQAHIPKFEYCTDNAAMIAITAYYKFIEGEFAGLNESANARSTF